MKLEFPLRCFFFPPKNTQISNFMKIRRVGSELFHAGRNEADGLFAVTRTYRKTAYFILLFLLFFLPFFFFADVAIYVFITGLFSMQVSMAISGAPLTKCLTCAWTCIHSL
jgi:hypothetical protein